MLKTPLCELLGIEYPILQGGMAWVATGELAAAVSLAGGLGIIGAGNAPPQWVQGEIRKVKSLTGRPFGVNVMLMSPFAEQVMEVVLRERVPVVTTGAGNPGKYIPDLKENGTKIVPVVSSVALAKRLARSGVDAIIAEGMESGGHIGQITTMVLVPQVVDAVDLPVIAAGGIADGRGLAAALTMGAQGVQMGTRFMCADECTVHPKVKQMILGAKDRDTAVTGEITGHPVRVLRNKLVKRYEELAAVGASAAEVEELGVGALRAAMRDGDTEFGSVMAGQIAAVVNEIIPARDIIHQVVADAKQILARAATRYCSQETM